MGGGGGSVSEDPAAKRLRARQAEDLVKLDEEENTRVKRMLARSTGQRVFAGSSALRIARGNSTAGPRASSYGIARSDVPSRRRWANPAIDRRMAKRTFYNRNPG